MLLLLLACRAHDRDNEATSFVACIIASLCPQALPAVSSATSASLQAAQVVIVSLEPHLSLANWQQQSNAR